MHSCNIHRYMHKLPKNINNAPIHTNTYVEMSLTHRDHENGTNGSKTEMACFAEWDSDRNNEMHYHQLPTPSEQAVSQPSIAHEIFIDKIFQSSRTAAESSCKIFYRLLLPTCPSCCVLRFERRFHPNRILFWITQWIQTKIPSKRTWKKMSKKRL